MKKSGTRWAQVQAPWISFKISANHCTRNLALALRTLRACSLSRALRVVPGSRLFSEGTGRDGLVPAPTTSILNAAWSGSGRIKSLMRDRYEE